MVILLNKRSYKVNVAQHINHCYKTSNKSELQRVKKELNNNLKELGTFFEEYLEVFSTQMDAADQTSPVWKAYKDKYKAYELIQSQVKQCDYYLNMINE
jgi:hypothetical protein